jgi:hypothetical protein
VFSRSLASKRGNEVYAWELRKKLSEIADVIEPMLRIDSTHTNALFVTLTDPHLGRRADAWLSMGERFNRFVANLRKTDPDVLVVVRSWESTKNGWPHVHVLLIFPSRSFKTQLRWSEKKRRMISRVNGTRAWKRHWIGHMDVQGCETTKGAVYYITKEVLKYGEKVDDQAALTQAICWASNRRSYAVSRRLNELLRDASSGERRLDVQEGKSNSNWRFEGMLEPQPNEDLKHWVQHVDELPQGLRNPRKKIEVEPDPPDPPWWEEPPPEPWDVPLWPQSDLGLFK